MSQLPIENCRLCKGAINQDMVFGSTIICGTCKNTFQVPRKKSKAQLILFAFLGTALLFGGAFYIYKKTRGYDELFASLSEEELRQSLKRCPDIRCEIAAYKRLHELKPSQAVYTANYAFRLTDSGQYSEAQSLYDSMLSAGEGTYDLMAYAARNLVGLNRESDAVKWYEGALSIQPQLYDVTKELALTLVKLKDRDSAISLLRSFVDTHPNTRGRLEGNIRSLLETHPEALSQDKLQNQKIRLYASRGGHHFISVTIAEKSEMFMVDTGSSLLAVPTELFEKILKSKARNLKQAQLKLADGRIVTGHTFVIPELKVGRFLLKDIEAAHCENCAPLLGRSVLRHFKTQSKPKGRLEIMEITPAAEI